jgi:carbonic anhydrase
VNQATKTLTAGEALEKLREGNRRFMAGGSLPHAIKDGELSELAIEQHPFAIVLGCSDSRVPAELVFDQGLGDLFVIRVAGNIVAPSQIGSVEFAAATFRTPLVVVLGHSECGVIDACVHELRSEPSFQSRSMSTIVDRVKPVVAPLLKVYDDDDDALIAAATRTNVLSSVKQLSEGSSVIRSLVESQSLAIVGAHYTLDTGAVDFFS